MTIDLAPEGGGVLITGTKQELLSWQPVRRKQPRKEAAKHRCSSRSVDPVRVESNQVTDQGTTAYTVGRGPQVECALVR